MTAHTTEQLIHALEESNSLFAALMHEPRSHDELEAQLLENRDAIEAARRAPAVPVHSVLARAKELHEKGFMPWTEAERLALDEAGIEEGQLDELIGNCSNTTLISLLEKEDVREFVRSILVHQPLAAAPRPPDAFKTHVAAPVELPEPGAWLFIDRTWTEIKAMGLDHGGKPAYTEQQVRQLLAAQQVTLTDEQIDAVFNGMPDGAQGFLKSWGYRQFARAALDASHHDIGGTNAN